MTLIKGAVFLVLYKLSCKPHLCFRFVNGNIKTSANLKVSSLPGNLLSLQPDLTQVTTVQSPVYDSPNNNHMNMFDELPAYAEVKDHINSPQGGVGTSVSVRNNIMMVEPSVVHSDSSSGSVRNERNLPSNTVMVSPITPYACGNTTPPVRETDILRDSPNSLVSEGQTSHIDTDAVTWSTFDHRGGRLTLPESGVSLLIPEGAIRPGQTEEIYMAVCRDDKDRPRLSGNTCHC